MMLMELLAHHHDELLATENLWETQPLTLTQLAL